MSIETLIIKNILQNDAYARKVIPYIKPQYFQAEHKQCFDTIIKFVGHYNKLPDKDALIVELEGKPQALALVSEIYTPLDFNHPLEWLYEKTEQWCKDRAVTIAILESVDIVEGKDKKKRTRDAIPSIMSDALSITFDDNIGHDYFDNIKDRVDYYTGKSTDIKKIPFRLQDFNLATNGGIETKSLNLVLGGTGGGKTLSLCSFAADYLLNGVNVLYITLEMADLKIAQRIDANLLNIDMDTLRDTNDFILGKAIKTLQTKTEGKLFIKEYPNHSINVNHIRTLMDELLLKKKFSPTVVFVDYLNLMSSSKSARSQGLYEYYKSVAEEMRALAQERNIAMWSATQTNRQGFGKSDIDVDDTSDSMGVPFTVDFMIGVYADDSLQRQGKVLFTQASKNRYADIYKHPKFIVGCDRSKMKLYNLEER